MSRGTALHGTGATRGAERVCLSGGTYGRGKGKGLLLCSGEPPKLGVEGAGPFWGSFWRVGELSLYWGYLYSGRVSTRGYHPQSEVHSPYRATTVLGVCLYVPPTPQSWLCPGAPPVPREGSTCTLGTNNTAGLSVGGLLHGIGEPCAGGCP